MSSEPRRLLPAIAAVGVTQIIGWGTTFHLPGVLGERIAGELGFDLTVALLGPTVMLVALAGVSWGLTGWYERVGSRPVMTLGMIIAAVGLAALAAAQGPVTYLLAWLVIGVAGAGSLTTAAQIAIAEISGDRARQSIGVLALFSGLAATIFWPLSAALDVALGWRVTLLIFAASVLVVCVPAVRWAIPPRTAPPATGRAGVRAVPVRLHRTAFALMAGAIAANGFITWGFSLTLIPLFEDRGLGRPEAVAIASSLGLLQIAARVADAVGGRRWTGLATGLVASSVLPIAYLVLLLGSGSGVVIIFVALYGLAGGAMAVARSTIPLAVFPREAYARASARLALPLNLAFAAAPPAFGAILTYGGADLALVVAAVMSAIALLLLIMLAVRARGRGTAAD